MAVLATQFSVFCSGNERPGPQLLSSQLIRKFFWPLQPWSRSCRGSRLHRLWGAAAHLRVVTGAPTQGGAGERGRIAGHAGAIRHHQPSATEQSLKQQQGDRSGALRCTAGSRSGTRPLAARRRAGRDLDRGGKGNQNHLPLAPCRQAIHSLQTAAPLGGAPVERWSASQSTIGPPPLRTPGAGSDQNRSAATSSLRHQKSPA